MEFVSTRGSTPSTSLRDAVRLGLAPDGGLFMPAHVPVLPPKTLEDLGRRDWPELAAGLTRALLGSQSEGGIPSSLATKALDFPIPLVRIGPRMFVLELFRGPTLAFKDVGARFMARLLSHFQEVDDPPLTVLTATSGDTGGAVAQAFHGMAGIRVVVLFPDGKVTPRQERQFSTLGGNVLALAVQGDFDDCQRLAKEAFREAGGLARGQSSSAKSTKLTSANSINIGRFLPQSFYFFHLWVLLRRLGSKRTKTLISVPSGNFGNLAAGLLARGMGLGGMSFVAATNENDVVPAYLDSGTFRPRPSRPTLSTAMDVGDPSNLDRILHLYQGDLERLRKDVVGHRVTDEETRSCIRRIHNDTGYVLDPHTAVGWVALERELGQAPDAVGVVLATAHPAKFAEVVEPVLEMELVVPPELARCLNKDRRVRPLEPRLDALLPFL